MTQRQQKRLITAIVALLVVGIGAIADRQQLISPSQPSETVVAQSSGQLQVVSVEDGDTITVLQNNVKEKVRLIGVDTPEVRDPRKAVQCYGKAASQFTTNLIGTNTIRLESDPTNSDRDRYDRLLRYVYLADGTLVNAAIIAQGYGFAYRQFPFEKEAEFSQLESIAKAEGRGLWGSCNVTTQNSGVQQTNND